MLSASEKRNFIEKTLNADYLLTLAFEQVLQSGARRKREEEK